MCDSVVKFWCAAHIFFHNLHLCQVRSTQKVQEEVKSHWCWSQSQNSGLFCREKTLVNLGLRIRPICVCAQCKNIKNCPDWIKGSPHSQTWGNNPSHCSISHVLKWSWLAPYNICYIYLSCTYNHANQDFADEIQWYFQKGTNIVFSSLWKMAAVQASPRVKINLENSEKNALPSFHYLLCEMFSTIPFTVVPVM